MPSACRLLSKERLRRVAREDGTTLNQFIVNAVVEKLAALKTADYFAKRAARADFRAFDRLTGSSRSSKAECSRFAQERLWE
jgi:hypothetical protein